MSTLHEKDKGCHRYLCLQLLCWSAEMLFRTVVDIYLLYLFLYNGWKWQMLPHDSAPSCYGDEITLVLFRYTLIVLIFINCMEIGQITILLLILLLCWLGLLLPWWWDDVRTLMNVYLTDVGHLVKAIVWTPACIWIVRWKVWQKYKNMIMKEKVLSI